MPLPPMLQVPTPTYMIIYTKNRNYNNLSGAVKGLTFPERESGTAKILLFCFEFIGPPRDFDDYRREVGGGGGENITTILVQVMIMTVTYRNSNTSLSSQMTLSCIYLMCEIFPSIFLLFTKYFNFLHFFFLLECLFLFVLSQFCSLLPVKEHRQLARESNGWIPTGPAVVNSLGVRSGI